MEVCCPVRCTMVAHCSRRVVSTVGVALRTHALFVAQSCSGPWSSMRCQLPAEQSPKLSRRAGLNSEL